MDHVVELGLDLVVQVLGRMGGQLAQAASQWRRGRIFGGTAQFGSDQANETELTSAGGADIFARYGGVEFLDSDGDGVRDEDDFCPDTSRPELRVPGDRLLPNRFAITSQSSTFSSGGPGATRETFTLPSLTQLAAAASRSSTCWGSATSTVASAARLVQCGSSSVLYRKIGGHTCHAVAKDQ
jgi:hypothetical protein